MRKLKLLFATLGLLLGTLGAKAQFENALPTTGWRSASSSFHPDGSSATIDKLFDGNTGTYWHSNYGGGTGQQGLPQWFIITLPEAKWISGFGIQRRNGNANCPKNYKVYVSDSDFGLTAPATNATQRDAVNSIPTSFLAGEGELPESYSNSNTLQQVSLSTPVYGKYILFVINGTYGSTNYTCLSEFKLYTYSSVDRTLLQSMKDTYQPIFDLIPEGSTFGCVPTSAPERANASDALSEAQDVLDGSDDAAIEPAANNLVSAMEALQQASVGHGKIYLIKCVGNSKYAIYNSGCVKSADDNTVILSNWANYDRRSFFTVKVAEIDGENIYYTISSALSPTQYVYAINTDGTDGENSPAQGNVGVKEITVGTAIPEDAKWKFNARGAGWNIIPKNGNNGWNCRGSYGGNAHIGQWHGNDTDDNTWTIKTAEEHLIETKVTPYTESVGTVGSITSIEQAADEAREVADILTTKYTDTELNAYKNYYPSNVVTPTSGLYKVYNKGCDLYLYSEQTSNNPKNVTLGTDLHENAKYYWNVTFDGNQATIIGSTGLSMAKGPVSTAYSAITADYISPITLKVAPNGNALWTEDYFVLPSVHSTKENGYTKDGGDYVADTNPIYLTTWDGTGAPNQYCFVPVTLPSEKDVYTVEFSGQISGDEGLVVKYIGGNHEGNTEVYNGGFFVLSTTEAIATNFEATAVAGRKYTITIEGTRIRVYYTIDETAKFYVPGSRATTLTTGKKYFIYNTCCVPSSSQNRSGFIWNNGTTKIGVNQTWPSEAKTLSNAYLFELEDGGEGKYYIKSLATGKYVSDVGDPTKTAGVALTIEEYSESGKKSGEDCKSYTEASEQANETPGTGSHVWAIYGGRCWNGNTGSFADWTTAHPYAFYEVNEVDYNGEIDEVQNSLNDAISKTGVGYPKQSVRNTLHNAVQPILYKAINPATAIAEYNTAITSYKSSTDVNLPEDGKAYKITNIQKDGTKKQLYYTDANGLTVGTNDIEYTGAEATFICRKVTVDNEDRYVFLFASAGKYMKYKGLEQATDANGSSDTYHAGTQAFKLPSNASESTVISNYDVLGGTFRIVAVNRSEDNAKVGSLVIKKADGNFDGYGNSLGLHDDYSNLFRIEEVTDPRTSVNIASRLPDDTRYVCTYSNSFPTVVPTGVKAYIVSQTNETTAGTRQLADEGEAIPANTGVLLVADAYKTIEPAEMKPATTEDIQEATGNLLVGTGATEATVDGDVDAYILANGSHGVAFYELSSSNRTIASYRAYLVMPTAGARPTSLRISFDDDIETGIDNIEGTENASGNAAIYDLSGRRIQNPVKGGLYVKGGIKYIHQ